MAPVCHQRLLPASPAAARPGPGSHARLPGGCLGHHSWKRSGPCLRTHVGYVAHSAQMAFYIYCLAYLVIFSHAYGCFRQADNGIFEKQEDYPPLFFPSVPGACQLTGREQSAQRMVQGSNPTCRGPLWHVVQWGGCTHFTSWRDSDSHRNGGEKGVLDLPRYKCPRLALRAAASL